MRMARCPDVAGDVAPGDLLDLSVMAAPWSKMGPRGRRVVLRIAERVALGAELYGEDFDAGRDWKGEAAEEAMDAAVYLARAG